MKPAWPAEPTLSIRTLLMSGPAGDAVVHTIKQRFPNFLLCGPLFCESADLRTSFSEFAFLRTPIICDITFVTRLISNNINQNAYTKENEAVL